MGDSLLACFGNSEWETGPDGCRTRRDPYTVVHRNNQQPQCVTIPISSRDASKKLLSALAPWRSGVPTLGRVQDPGSRMTVKGWATVDLLGRGVIGASFQRVPTTAEGLHNRAAAKEGMGR